MPGRIDVHAHLLPAIDDGCASVEESLACARRMVEAGYTHLFCTPHFWPNLPHNTVHQIGAMTQRMQVWLDDAAVPLRVMSGGEINLRPDYLPLEPEEIPTFGMKGRYVLADLWVEKLPEYVQGAVRWLADQGMTMILAHPERMRAIQEDPAVADLFGSWGVLLQGNLQCLSDPPDSATRRTVEKFLREDKYFLLGSDLHNLDSLGMRLAGLNRAIEIVGRKVVDRLTIENPQKLLDAWFKQRQSPAAPPPRPPGHPWLG